jgi:hypothetical protein
MKLKSATIWLSAIALLAVATVVVLEIQRSPQTEEQAQGIEPLFEFEEDQIQAFTLTTAEYDLAFEKDDEGVWQQRSPEGTKANDASVAYLLNLLASGESDRILEIPADDWTDFGFEEPLAVIEVTVEGDGTEETRSLTLGNYDFNGSSIYALRDLPEDAPDGLETLDVLLVTPDFENAVRRPIEEWIQPEDVEPSSDAENSSADEATEPSAAPETETPEAESGE